MNQKYKPQTLVSILKNLKRKGYPEVEYLTFQDLKELYKHEWGDKLPPCLDDISIYSTSLSKEDVELLKIEGHAPVTRRYFTEPQEAGSSVFAQYNITESK